MFFCHLTFKYTKAPQRPSEMEYAFTNLSTVELKNSAQIPDAFKLSDVCSSIEEAHSTSSSIKGELLRDIRLTEDANHENEPKSCVLDPYCETNALNESSDFIDCDSRNKFKYKLDKYEILCEICKKNITDLDIYNRGIHVNNCMDEQVSHDSEIKTQAQASDAENAFLLECPICFKQFSSTELRSIHIKKCGKSKGLSVQSIVKALKLQEKHALERISLGLPAKQLKVVKSHKNPVPKRAVIEPKSKAHSDIQLAKALSLSLATPVHLEEVRPTLLEPPTVHQRPGKKAKTALCSATPLLVLRSEEERKRLLLDKVARIVAPVNSAEEDSLCLLETSKQLKENYDELPLLWCLSSKACEASSYYVGELIDWIQASHSGVDAKLCHLSQVPGHEIVTQLPCDYTFSASPQDDKRRRCVDPVSISRTSASVIKCLRSLVASSWMSDVDIHTMCGTVVPAHSLLLAARCPPLKHDSSFCSGSGRVVLKWETISFDTALQFLNFVYTGNIEIKENMVSDLSHLAEKYEVLDLQSFLHDAYEDSNLLSSVVCNSRVSLITGGMCPLSSQSQPMQVMCESQEEKNVDLDIVFDCIRSNLGPTQPCDSNKSFHMKSTIPHPDRGEGLVLLVRESGILPTVDHSVHGEFWKESSSSSSCPSMMRNDRPNTSSMIFNVSDNERDSSDSENVELLLCCSQKLSSGQLGQDEKEKSDVCDAESNNSQDSVKFLKSSFTSFNDLSRSSEKVENDLLWSPPNSLKVAISSSNKSPSKMSDSLMYSAIPQELNEFHSEMDSKVERSSSQMLRYFSHKEDIQTLDGTEASNDHLDPLSETILENETSKKSDDTTTCVIRTDDAMNEDLALEACCGTDKFKMSSKDSPAFKCRGLSSPEILTCDSDSNSESYPTMSLCTHLSTEATHVGGVSSSDFQVGKENFLRNTTLTERHRAGSSHQSESSSVDAEIVSYCSPRDGSCAVNRRPSHCSEGKESNNILSCIGSPDEEKEMSIRDSCKVSVSSPETLGDPPYANFEFDSAVKENSETAPIHYPKSTGRKAILPFSELEGGVPSRCQFSDSPVTPLPDYRSMMTPEIKQALRKIGVKALPRKKALALLTHVYDETHPVIDTEASVGGSTAISSQKTPEKKIMKAKKRKFLSENIQKPSKKQPKEIHSQEASQESDDSSFENPEWLGCVPEMSFSQSQEDSPTKTSKDDIESIQRCIQSNEDLYTRILSYKPLNMVEFHQELKNCGVKISIQKLMDFLDGQCITFTCPRKEEYRKKQMARTQRFRRNKMAQLSQL